MTTDGPSSKRFFLNDSALPLFTDNTWHVYWLASILISACHAESLTGAVLFYVYMSTPVCFSFFFLSFFFFSPPFFFFFFFSLSLFFFFFVAASCQWSNLRCQWRCRRTNGGKSFGERQLWTHANLFRLLSRDGHSHGSGMSHATTASLAPSSRLPWRVDDAREKAGWRTSMSGRPCPCQNCPRWPPSAEPSPMSPDDPNGHGTGLNWTTVHVYVNMNDMIFNTQSAMPVILGRNIICYWLKRRGEIIDRENTIEKKRRKKDT